MSARSVENAALRRDVLKESFSSVPLGLKLLGGPIEPRSRSIFQMDISNSPRFERTLLQLVLRVKEPRRPFIRVIRKDGWTTLERVQEEARAADGRILSESRREWRLQLRTPGDDRRFLCGRDDLHLFIAQIGQGDTVAEAHAAGRPDTLRD